MPGDNGEIRELRDAGEIGGAVTVEIARELYERRGGGHDFDHVLRVTALAERIAMAEGADLAIVRTAALLHDVAERHGRHDHHLRGAEMARAILADRPAEFVEAVAHAIEAHRFRADPPPRTLEAKCLSDADKLDAIGAIGVARVFAYAGARGSALWRCSWRTIASAGGDPSTLPKMLGCDYTPVHEFVLKLNRIPDRLYTATARAIAAERQAFMITFFDRLDQEMEGEA
ncbi:MAG: HD domain-containing protein [Anaerolineae bacterium]